MPLTFAQAGEDYLIRKIGGKPEIKKHLENLALWPEQQSVSSTPSEETSS